MDLDQYNRVDLEHIIERWEPVIEAAKALRLAWTETDKVVAHVALCKALDELQAAEGEE